ncbi:MULTISPECIES: hypothetical protein [unclassified Brenneria]|uniref:hypothetical protein n=1 Tax=unclassified Brenneria TaxID=2634434 RepID=UPI0029C5F18B|nr:MULTISPECIES: hypothetical protein [unclassified Brenneria]MDX5627340.1 hypothetical protein [Brenneria sp. L3-3Z]MDX5694504.1 hypothetical protein [Brenneria sp. L4-2C]MEE3661872.1 hypothetical protein [Brenneria sp. g21c3]
MTNQPMSFQQLSEYLSRIPEEISFTGSSKAKFKSLTIALLSLCFAVVLLFKYLEASSGKGALILFSVITVFFFILTFKQWGDGKISIVKLTHTDVTVKDLNKKIPLECIENISYTYDSNDTLKIFLKEKIKDLALTSKFNSLRGASVSIQNKKDKQVIVIIVPYSFNVDGKRLYPEEIQNIFEQYLSIPAIKKEMIISPAQ